MIEHSIAWWNVENLFDVFDSPQRPAWLQSELAGELAGWTQVVLDRKLVQLASIVSQIDGGLGPDLLGVCEIENQVVLDLLVAALAPLGRNYQVAHHDMGDQRGIDVAFLYDADRFTAELQFSHEILKRAATRDLFQVNFRATVSGALLVVVGNHWPSRSAGQYESEPYRILAAETLSYWHKRILEIQGEDTAILVMGDLNDEPDDRSLAQYALSTRNVEKVRRASLAAPRFFNLMWPLYGSGIGTHYYENFPNLLDQVMVSKGMLRQDAVFRVAEGSTAILRPPEMQTGTYNVPRRHGRPSSGHDPDGFSDHYPVTLRLVEED
ncbi:MAG: endonuclease/exonuclease/phosphatase family protein [Thermoanaerobaculia bacterium]